jgi:ribosomal protein S18 acetylase RimI-like enzyme
MKSGIHPTRPGRSNRFPRYLADSSGRKYVVVVDDDSRSRFEVRLEHPGVSIGKALCTGRARDEMEFSDLIIEPPYRQRGLGAKLLRLVISHLREKGVKEIYGSVMGKDLKEFPNMVEWYERLGFRKGERYPYAIDDAVVYLHLDLQANMKHKSAAL